MWQRIQTLYLLVSTVLIALMFFCNKAADVSYTSYWPYLVLLVIIAALDFLALTVYRFRIFQFRTCILSMLVTIALQAWIAVDFFGSRGVPFHITAIFPAVSAILDWMAARNIWADELMVRSADRLRSAKRKKK